MVMNNAMTTGKLTLKTVNSLVDAVMFGTLEATESLTVAEREETAARIIKESGWTVADFLAVADCA